jgi:hypothetical protein
VEVLLSWLLRQKGLTAPLIQEAVHLLHQGAHLHTIRDRFLSQQAMGEAPLKKKQATQAAVSSKEGEPSAVSSLQGNEPPVEHVVVPEASGEQIARPAVVRELPNGEKPLDQPLVEPPVSTAMDTLDEPTEPVMPPAAPEVVVRPINEFVSEQAARVPPPTDTPKRNPPALKKKRAQKRTVAAAMWVNREGVLYQSIADTRELLKQVGFPASSQLQDGGSPPSPPSPN